MHIHPNVHLEDFEQRAAVQTGLLPSVPISTDVSLSEHSDIHIGEITQSESMGIIVSGIHVLPEDSNEHRCGYITNHECTSLHAPFLHCATLRREDPAPTGGSRRGGGAQEHWQSKGGHSYSQVPHTASVVSNLNMTPGMNPPLITH